MKQITKISILTVLMALLCLGSSWAQEKSLTVGKYDNDGTEVVKPTKECPFTISLSALLRSRHVFKGALSYKSWNVQPSLKFSAYGFFLQFWSAIPLNIDWNTEIDIILGYTYGPFTIAYADWYYPNRHNKFNHLFDWSDKEHYRDNYFMLNFAGVEKFPIGIDFGMYTYGDKGGTGKERYSMNIELNYHYTLKTNQTIRTAVGGTPYGGRFAAHAAFTHVQLGVDQPVKVTDSYTFTVSGDIILNPYRNDLFFMVGVKFL